jgi:hypothetical protein
MLNSELFRFLALTPSSHLRHGQFGNWLKENWEMERSTAERYMEIAMLKTSLVMNLTLITDALKLAKQEAKPKIRQQVLEVEMIKVEAMRHLTLGTKAVQSSYICSRFTTEQIEKILSVLPSKESHVRELLKLEESP